MSPTTKTRHRPTRRRLLASAVAVGVGSVAGCAGVLGPKPMRLRAMPAAGDETDVRCELSASFVGEYPPLKRVLDAAADNDPGEWAGTGLSEERGTALGDALVEHCDEETRGLYRYDGDWFFLSLSFRDAQAHDEAEGDHHHGNESVTEHTH